MNIKNIMTDKRKLGNAIGLQFLLALWSGAAMFGAAFADDAFFLTTALIVIFLLAQIIVSIFYWKRLHSLSVFVIPLLVTLWMIFSMQAMLVEQKHNKLSIIERGLHPVITSISPSVGPIGTIVELKGENLVGFEGDRQAFIENSQGEVVSFFDVGPVPRDEKTIRVKIENKVCKEQFEKECISYLIITPGTYNIYTYLRGNISNKVQFMVTK